MIFLLAGTKDGRELAAALAEAGVAVLVSVVSEYGQALIPTQQVSISVGGLDKAAMARLLVSKRITLVVDASHPYAVSVSQNAMSACQMLGIAYLRYERPTVALPDYQYLSVADDYQHAIQLAARAGRTIFLTIGSRMLGIFKNHPVLAHHRIVARVLPELATITVCSELGFKPKDIVAMQGPFSHALNVALFREYAATVIVSKNSGEIGGTDTKITAAIELGLPIVIVARPTVEYVNVAHSISDVLQYISQCIKL
jgi:precorrin-6A/cobalt-precorrin-6A reductase